MPRKLKPCGTVAAYRRHLRWGEETCAACRQAQAAYMREYSTQIPTQPQVATACGTSAGYSRHRRYREEPCAECRKAAAKQRVDLYAAQRAKEGTR